MDAKPSGIPRPSRLPVPKGVRPSASRDNLQQSKLTFTNPRLRPSASRDQLSKPRAPATPLRSRASANFRDVSTGTVVHTPPSSQSSRKTSHEPLFRVPSQPVTAVEDTLGEDDDTLIAVEQVVETPQLPRKTRPSLSERTMETLQNIPSSPAVRKRGSSFFNNENPARSPTRSVSSRPTSSAGPGNSISTDFRAFTNTFKAPQSVVQPQSLKRPGTVKSLKTPGSVRSAAPVDLISSSKLQDQDETTQGSPTPTFLKAGSRSVVSRPLKQRDSIDGLFRKPSTPALDQSGDVDRVGFTPKKKVPVLDQSGDVNRLAFTPKKKPFAPAASSSDNASSESASASRGSHGTASTSISSVDEQQQTPRKSSLALRDQIAKAKAAKRAAAVKQAPGAGQEAIAEEVPVIAAGSFDFGLSNDPFNQKLDPNDSKGLLRKRVAAARMDGRLNIAAMGFKDIPEEVMDMYSLNSIGTKDGSWAEAVDLTRFIAADNELEVISDDIFPDVDPRDNMDDDDAKGNQFGGLQMLDFHGNLLTAVPMGLRRLELLTTLNLSHNKLTNDCLRIVSQIKSLRDLKLAGNGLAGQLDESLTSLTNLEDLDLRQNTLTGLPDGLAELVRLRILNLAENQFRSLPFDCLRKLPLTQLLAAKNKLTGTLIAEDIDELPHLQILDVTANALSSLHISTNLRLPALHQLSCSANRLSGLPDMTTWLCLLTIAAEDNSISAIPQDFVALPKIKNVDFSGNNIKVLDDRIGGMESLDILRISGNPLRDRKFAGMSTDDLKRALKARMEPVVVEVERESNQRRDSKDQDVDGAFYSAPVSPVSQRPSSSDWLVQAGGVLDRSNTKSHSLNPVAAANVAADHQIKILELHHNMFKEFPDSIAFFATNLTTLSLAHNELTSDTFIKDSLDLPVLKELNISSNTFNSLQPLMQRLQAPMLEHLDISFNRLTSLPMLRPHFPRLTTLLASHNTIKELSPESIKGFRIVDLSSNDINSLNARIGLLGGPGGLEKFDVSGNRFRVPKYTVLDKGTEATLAWLKDRIPVGDAAEQDVD